MLIYFNHKVNKSPTCMNLSPIRNICRIMSIIKKQHCNKYYCWFLDVSVRKCNVLTFLLHFLIIIFCTAIYEMVIIFFVYTQVYKKFSAMFVYGLLSLKWITPCFVCLKFYEFNYIVLKKASQIFIVFSF